MKQEVECTEKTTEVKEAMLLAYLNKYGEIEVALADPDTRERLDGGLVLYFDSGGVNRCWFCVNPDTGHFVDGVTGQRYTIPFATDLSDQNPNVAKIKVFI